MKATIYPLLVAYTAFAAAKSVEKASSQKKKKKIGWRRIKNHHRMRLIDGIGGWKGCLNDKSQGILAG
jgi:hypothetical protein